MSKENPSQPDGQLTKPNVPQTPAKTAPRKGKGKAKSNARVKALIAGFSVAATIGGWGLMAQHDATTAAQAALDQANVGALVSEATTQQSPEAIVTSIATATATATFPSTATPSTTATSPVQADIPQAAATDTPLATATDTPQPTDTPVPTTAPQRIITTTRSSK